MISTCKNCSQEFNGKFCNNCGQTVETHKINLHYLWLDLRPGLFYFDKGILYTIKQLLTRPGYSIKEFLEGKRIQHIKPISLIVVLAAIYGILYHTFHYNMFSELTKLKDLNGSELLLEKYNDWTSSHYSWIQLLMIPFFALGSFVAFRKQGYNYAEHLVIASFLTGQKLIIRIITLPLPYFFSERIDLNNMTQVLLFFEFFLSVWVYTQIFKPMPKIRVFLLALLGYLIFWLAYAISMIIVIVLVALIMR